MLNENGGTGNMELDNNVWSRAGTGTMKNVPNLSPLSSCALSASSILSLSTPLLVKTKLPICRRISSFVLKFILCLCAKGCPVRAKIFLICRRRPSLFFSEITLIDLILVSFLLRMLQICVLMTFNSLFQKSPNLSQLYCFPLFRYVPNLSHLICNSLNDNDLQMRRNTARQQLGTRDRWRKRCRTHSEIAE